MATAALLQRHEAAVELWRPATAPQASPATKSYLSSDIGIAYAAFAVCACFITFARSSGEYDVSRTLVGVVNGLDGGIGGIGVLLLFAALAPVCFPRLWRGPWAALGALAPLAITLFADIRYAEAQMQIAYGITDARLDQASSILGGVALTTDALSQMKVTDPYMLGFGALATLGLATYIAARGALSA